MIEQKKHTPADSAASPVTELTLLATMLSKPALFAQALSNGITVDHFRDLYVRELVLIAFEQFEEYGETNVVTVTSEAMERGYTNEDHAVWNLQTTDANPLSFSDSLRRVMTSAKLRRFYDLVGEIRDSVWGVESLSLMQREKNMYLGINKLLNQVQEKESTFYDADTVASIARKNYEDALKGTRKQLQPTGIRSLDNCIGGLDNRVVMVCARPSHGKTAFCTWLTQKSSLLWKKEGKPGQVLYFSAEMGINISTDRIVSSVSGVNARTIAAGSANDLQKPDIEKALGMLREDMRVSIDTHSSPTTAYMMSRALAQNAAEPVKLIIFDYLEYTGEEGTSEDLRLGKALKGCHEIAKRIGCPVVVVSQLNRNIEKRGADARPQLADIRYTGAAEQIASLVIMLYHPWIHWHQRGQQGMADAEEPDPGEYELLIRKNTNGPIGGVRLFFDRETTGFRDPLESNYKSGKLVAQIPF